MAVEQLEDRRLFAFGVTAGTAPTGQPTLVVDNGGNIKFSIINGGTLSSTLHQGDLSSVQYKGHELLASYALTGRYSHYEQGFGSTAVITPTVDATNGWILVKVDDSVASTASATQYYAVRKNDDNIYMASLPTDVTAGPGEGRFIAYLDRSVFTAPEAASDNAGTTGAIEGSDVFGHADGTTTSKFYNDNRRMIDNIYHGLTGVSGGTSVGAWMFMGDREHSAGGPFMKDIDFQASDTQVEMYNCLFTGHTQTEAYRQGLYTYAMQLTNGSAPVAPDYSWLESLKDSSGNFLISGLIPAAQRGSLSGVVTGIPAGHPGTVTLSNTTAQYWAAADATSGNYSIAGIQPGTYTETLYDGELAVGTRTVTISAGKASGANMTDVNYVPSTIWRIGTWDGTPAGFLNADKISTEHPSDVRMSNWVAPTFVVGTSADTAFPLATFKDINNGQQIAFSLTTAQAATALTMRIGITFAFAGGRPAITVNTGQTYAWTSALPASPSEPNSRGITRGTWRGNNFVFTYNIPTSALRAGTNTINIGVNSGQTSTGFLSPSITYDALDLVPTASLTSAPVVSSIAINPSGAVAKSTQYAFSAISKDQFGNVAPANLVWTALNGTIDHTGLYTAPAATGSDTVTASYNGITASYTFNVINAAPVIGIATPAAATPNPVLATSTALSVLGTDNTGESNLVYTWAVSGTSPAPVTFSANGTNAAKNATATFIRAGTYTFVVTATDGNAVPVSSTVNVTVSFGAFTDSVDVGGPAMAGSMSYNSTTGAYTVKGGGTDIWNAADQLRYDYSSLAGDGAVIARVSSSSNSNTRAKAGVMFRDSNATNAAYALVCFNPNGTVLFETRASNGASSSYSVSATTAFPAWIKLVRSGNTFAAYYSTNGTSWTQLGTKQTVTLASTAEAGLAVCSHAATILNTTVFDNVSIAAAPTIAAFVVNNGAIQRSMLTSLAITFSQAVTLASDAFTLTRSADGATIPLTLSTTDNITYTISFTGSGITAGSLADGIYTLAVKGASVTTSTVPMASNGTYVFHRLFGDFNGDKTVDALDSRAFRSALNGTYQSLFDYNGDGFVDAIDSRQFRLRLDTFYTY